MHSVYSIPSHSASFRTGVEARSRDRECQPGELEPGNLYTVDLRNETQSKSSRSRSKKKVPTPRVKVVSPSFRAHVRILRSPVPPHLTSSVTISAGRFQCLVAHTVDTPRRERSRRCSVTQCTQWLPSPLITSRKRSPYRRWQSAGNHGNFSDKHRLLDPGTRSGNWQGPNNCLHRRSRPPSISFDMLGHPPSHRPNRSGHVAQHLDRESSPHTRPPALPLLVWKKRPNPGRIRIGRAGHFRPGRAGGPGPLSSMNTRLCRSLDWLKMARRPHGKPNLIDDLNSFSVWFPQPPRPGPSSIQTPIPPSPPMKPAWPKRAKQTRHAQPLVLHPVPTSRVHRSDPTVEFIDIPPSICLSPVSSWSLGHPMAAACRGWSDRSLGPSSPKGDFHRQDAGEAGHGRARFYHC